MGDSHTLVHHTCQTRSFTRAQLWPHHGQHTPSRISRTAPSSWVSSASADGVCTQLGKSTSTQCLLAQRRQSKLDCRSTAQGPDWRGCTADRPTWFASMSTLTAPDQQAGFGHSSLSIRFDIVIGFKLSRHAPCVSSYPSTFPLHPVYNQRPLSLTSSRR